MSTEAPPTTGRPGAGQTRRHLLGGVSATVAGALLAACGGNAGPAAGGDAPQPSQGPVAVNAFIGITDVQINRFPDEIGASFKQLKPNVTLTATPQTGTGTQGVMERLTSLIAAGSPPDIFEGPRYPAVMVEKGFIEQSMDALVKRDKYKTDAYNPKEFAIRAKYQGKTMELAILST